MQTKNQKCFRFALNCSSEKPNIGMKKEMNKKSKRKVFCLCQVKRLVRTPAQTGLRYNKHCYKLGAARDRNL